MNSIVRITILGQEYPVKFPNVSQHMEIEAMKHAFTNGRYGEMINNSSKSALMNLDLVDAISTFSILIPDLKDKLNGVTLKTLDMMTGLQLVKAYTSVYSPFYNEIMKGINEELDKIGFNDKAN